MVSLEAARAQAARVRLSEDLAGYKLESHQLQGRSEHKDMMLRHGLLLSESMTPVLESRLQEVCERLILPRQTVTAFVYNDANVQADCLIDSPESCVLRFSSGLVNLMNDKEFQFIAAHELGHFLLGHGACSQYTGDGSSESFITQRARELSADRIGFLGVDNLDASLKAIIKTASGLGNEFLRFDVASFMSQTEMLSNPSRGESRNSTHPSMLIRCRAMLRFSMSITCLQDLKNIKDSVIHDIDKKVTRDLEKFVDGHIRVRRQEFCDDIALWKTCMLIISEGSFSKDVQDRVTSNLGEDLLRGLKSFFESHDIDELEGEAQKRFNSVISTTYSEFPGSADNIETAAVKLAYKIIGS